MRTLRLALLPGHYAICRLLAYAPLPAWATRGGFWSITHTADELSIVCLEKRVPPAATADRDWRCLKVVGPLGFGETGIIAGLTAVLAQVGVSVFVVSTYKTDYLLVKQAQLEVAITALANAGHSIAQQHASDR